jgi:hypothetical protein
MKIRLLAIVLGVATTVATNHLAVKAGGANSGADVGVGVTTNTTNQLISFPGGGGKGPVAPAYSPSPGSGSSLGHPGESRVRLQTQNVCGVYHPNGQLKDVIVLNSSMEVSEPSAVRQRGASLGLSLFNVGVSGGFSSGDVTPSNPHPKAGEYFLEVEASQIISCEAVGNPKLRRDRVEDALRTINVLRRGRLQGMAASEAAQLEPSPAPSRATQPAPPVRALW